MNQKRECNTGLCLHQVLGLSSFVLQHQIFVYKK